jgi:Xaa-Pro aminopeptidase
LLLIDVGAEFNHYAADITRTIAVSDKVSKRQRQVYESVHDVQQFAFGLLKEGLELRSYEEQIEHYMGEQLRVLGLISTIDKESVRKYYPHSTSHFLGLDPHDVGDYTLPLQENMVITVEPGIYIPEEGIGVRIEDDVVITKESYRNLSDNLPTTFN